MSIGQALYALQDQLRLRVACDPLGLVAILVHSGR
jgi:hypothetical protein